MVNSPIDDGRGLTSGNMHSPVCESPAGPCCPRASFPWDPVCTQNPPVGSTGLPQSGSGEVTLIGLRWGLWRRALSEHWCSVARPHCCPYGIMRGLKAGTAVARAGRSSLSMQSPPGTLSNGFALKLHFSEPQLGPSGMNLRSPN